VVVAVAAVRVVKMAGDQIIHVAAVRHRLVAAAGAVRMARVVPAAAMIGGAVVGVRSRYLDHVLVDMILVRVVKMAVVQIVRVAAVAHGRMSATRSMLMGMIGMGVCRASGHGIASFLSCPETADIPLRLSAA
jgi:hypothetical protein